MLTSTRRGIVYPNTNRADSADVPRDIAAVVAALEIDVIYGQGTLAARPTSSAGTPGIAGRLYYATDNSTVYYDFGTGWVALNVASGPTGAAGGDLTGNYPNPTIAASAVTATKIAVGSIDGSTKIIDATIPASKLAAALFPSQGAGAATEALRAIGSGAGNVVAGNDSRLTGVRDPTPGHDPSAFGTVLPSSGLFNGYRFTYYWAPVTGGYFTWDLMYRADLDATYPWHVTGARQVRYATSASVTATSPNNPTANTGVATVPRAGYYSVSARLDVTSNGGNGVAKLIAGGNDSGYAGSRRTGWDYVALGAGASVYSNVTDTYGNISLSTATVVATIDIIPQKLA